MGASAANRGEAGNRAVAAAGLPWGSSSSVLDTVPAIILLFLVAV